MELNVTMQSLGKRKPVLSAVPFPIDGAPDTLRALLAACVRTCVSAYNARLVAPVQPMSAETLSAMETVGKMAFGLNEGQRAANLESAVETAIQGFEDGLFRVFLCGKELTDLDAPIVLHEGDALLFIRLTFLTGSFY